MVELDGDDDNKKQCSVCLSKKCISGGYLFMQQEMHSRTKLWKTVFK